MRRKKNIYTTEKQKRDVWWLGAQHYVHCVCRIVFTRFFLLHKQLGRKLDFSVHYLPMVYGEFYEWNFVFHLIRTHILLWLRTQHC